MDHVWKYVIAEFLSEEDLYHLSLANKNSNHLLQNECSIRYRMFIEQKYKTMMRIIHQIDKNYRKDNGKTKILTRNSFERRVAHTYAKYKGVSHRSIIDYTQYHQNVNSEKIYYHSDRYEVSLTYTPYSFVELGAGYEKKIIGDPRDQPEPFTRRMYDFTPSRIPEIKRWAEEERKKKQ
jgi:hypothetical protein